MKERDRLNHMDDEDLRDLVIAIETEISLAAIFDSGDFSGWIENRRGDEREKAEQWCRGWARSSLLRYLDRASSLDPSAYSWQEQNRASLDLHEEYQSPDIRTPLWNPEAR